VNTKPIAAREPAIRDQEQRKAGGFHSTPATFEAPFSSPPVVGTVAFLTGIFTRFLITDHCSPITFEKYLLQRISPSRIQYL